MQIGQEQFSIEQSILYLALLIVLALNIFLFSRSHNSYSIKYELMKKHYFFRVNQKATMLVQFFFQSFFALPYIIIVAITILRALSNVSQFPSIFVNGLIVVLIIYPFHHQYYYLQYAIIWFLAVSSQFFSQFLVDPDPSQTSSFMELSFIFYTANSMIFCLALLSKQNVYWQLEQAIQLCNPADIQKVNEKWIQRIEQEKLPKIFYGGLYGWMAKKNSFTLFIGIYVVSLCILGVYAFLIYLIQKSYLGVTGLITAFVYDIFILIFSSLRSKYRSIKNLFFMIYVGRLLSFVFGIKFWLFGYCILYFLVGIFIGNIVIDKHFPLKVQIPNNDRKVKLNALKTPQFVLIILTAQIIVLILAQQLSNIAEVSNISFNNSQIPLWQFAILIVFATWIVILYLTSGRLLARHIKKIRSMVEYYFGFMGFTQYHIYMLLTYSLIIGGGVYCLLYLKDYNIFLGCLFLPLIYLTLFQIGAAWVKNNYAILADTDQYNKREYQKFETRKQIRKKKQERAMVRKLQKKLNQKIDINNINGQKTLSNYMNQTKMFESITGTFSYNKQAIQPLKQSIQSTPQIQESNQEQKIAGNDEHLVSLQNDQNNNQEKNHVQNQVEMSQTSEQTSGINIIDLVQQKYKNPNDDEFLELKNWRIMKQMTYSQTWQNLTKNDKTIIVFSIITALILISYSLVAGFWAKTISGVAFCISIIALLTAFPYYKSHMTGNQLVLKQMIIAVLGFLLGLAFWAAYFQITFGGIVWAVVSLFLYGDSLRNVFSKSSSMRKNIQSQKVKAEHQQNTFETQSDDNELSHTTVIVCLSIKVTILLIFICILLGLSYGAIAGIVIAGIIISIFLGIVNFHQLHKDGYISKVLKIIDFVVLAGMVATLALVGFISNVLSDFAVFTIVMFIVIIGFFLVYLILSFTKNAKLYQHPHVYSAYGLTIYRFESQNQKIKSSTNHVVIFNISMILLVIYSAVTTLFFKQKYVAIYTLSVFLITQFTQLIFRSIQTYYFLGEQRKSITKQIVSETLKKLIEKYMSTQIQGQDSPYFIKLFEETKEKALKATSQKQLDQLWSKTVEHKQQVLKNLDEEQKFLYFWLALIRFNLYTKRQNKMNEFIILVDSIKDQLRQYGIILESMNSTQLTQIKYQLIQKQVQSLIPQDAVIIQELLTVQKIENRKKQKQFQNVHKEIQEEHKKKAQLLFKEEQNLINSKKQDKFILNPIEQFNKKIELLKENQFFQDPQFTRDTTSLGFLNNFVKDWRRPTRGQSFISGDGMSPSDVKQGNIGDCYLISSFAVLGQKFLKKAIGYNSDGSRQWTNDKGGFMVKFHKFSRQIYITIDDYLPVNQKNERIFAKSQDSEQYWPGILQKAYAKLYRGYQNIVSGKCHQVLSQFSGGFPFQITIKQYKDNQNALWGRIKNSNDNGYLLAAGSPDNQRGDKADPVRGIVQGHAYSILDVKQLSSYKLIKLKNPHGSEGKEWTGDFSDSFLMNNVNLRKALGHKNQNDGIFWMKLQDFVTSFQSLYICCIFEKGWKKMDEIQDTWKLGINSFGRPQKSSLSQKNFQLGLTVHKKCTFFISLSQQNKTALQGNNYIAIRIVKNQGKRLKKTDVTSQKLCNTSSKPTTAAILSQQVQLQHNDYPYTFTIYVSAQILGKQNQTQPGSGPFKLQMFCNDDEAALINDGQFDRSSLP